MILTNGDVYLTARIAAVREQWWQEYSEAIYREIECISNVIKIDSLGKVITVEKKDTKNHTQK
jgi:hypothetical protein